MVVNIGGGTCGRGGAVYEHSGCVLSTKVARDAMDEAIMRYVRRKHGGGFGRKYGREVKITIGCVYPRPENAVVCWSRAGTRQPSQRPPTPGRGDSGGSEAACPADCGRDFHRAGANAAGIGGGFGPERHCAHGRRQPHLGHGAADPGADRASLHPGRRCGLLRGPMACGKSLAWINHMQEGTINLARRRLMQA